LWQNILDTQVNVAYIAENEKQSTFLYIPLIYSSNEQCMNKKEFNIRNATKADINDLMRVEQTWPEDQRASVDKFLARLEKFPEGFWVGEVDNRIVGMTTSCIVHYDPKDLSPFCSWNHATNNGYIFPVEGIAYPNALYVVSTVIEKAFRGNGLFQAFFEKHKEVTALRGLTYCLTGAMLPGYNAYFLSHGNVSAYDYAMQRKNGRVIDPLVEKLMACGFELPDERHIIPDYFHSPESRDYAALLVYHNPAFKRC
jgi:hypothetical protein